MTKEEYIAHPVFGQYEIVLAAGGGGTMEQDGGEGEAHLHDASALRPDKDLLARGSSQR